VRSSTGREISACEPSLDEESNPKLEQGLESRGDTIDHRYLGAQGYLRNRIELVNIYDSPPMPKLGNELGSITEDSCLCDGSAAKTGMRGSTRLRNMLCAAGFLGTSTDYEEDDAALYFRAVHLHRIALQVSAPKGATAAAPVILHPGWRSMKVPSKALASFTKPNGLHHSEAVARVASSKVQLRCS
jgi:hypothetical protein